MSLRIGDAFGDGVRRAVTYSGGLLMALMFVYQLLFVGALNRIVTALLSPEAQARSEFGLLLPVPVAVAAGLVVVGFLLGPVLYLWAARALTRSQSDLDSLPGELLTRRIGRATVSAVGANIVVSIAVLIGFLLLIVPGIFLAISFVFVMFAIGVEDERALDAIGRSWTLASGDRWPLLALGLLVFIVAAVGSSLGSILSFVSPVAGQVGSLALRSVFIIVGYAILAEAYVQLADEKPPNTDVGRPAPDPEPVA